MSKVCLSNLIEEVQGPSPKYPVLETFESAKQRIIEYIRDHPDPLSDDFELKMTFEGNSDDYEKLKIWISSLCKEEITRIKNSSRLIH